MDLSGSSMSLGSLLPSRSLVPTMFRSCISRHYLPLALGMALLLIGTACDEGPYDPPPIEPEPEPEPEDVVKQEVPKSKSTKSDEVFWTEERMEAAEPADPDLGSKAAKNSSVPLGPARPNPDREPKRQSGRLPEHTIKDLENVKGLAPSQKGHASLRESTQLPSSAHLEYPYRAVGKVFFLNSDGESRVCSGAVIYTKNRSTIWTAGHCVSEAGEQEWHDEWTFVPGYTDGRKAPFGRWSAREKATLRGFHVDGNRHYDLAAVKVERKDGEPIADITGSFGHVSNLSRDQNWQIMGYPVSGDLFGEDGQMWECSASFTETAEVGESGPPQSKVEDCRMTSGASGSPWITNFDDCPECWVNSAHSQVFYPEGRVNETDLSSGMGGPYHGEGAVNLYEALDGWKP